MNDSRIPVILFPGIFTLIGSIFLIIGLVMMRNWKKKEANCTSKTIGKVSDIVKHNSYDGENYHSLSYPIFEYYIGDLKLTQEYSYGESNSKYTIGQNIEIYYNPQSYNDYYIAEDTSPRKFATAFTAGGIISLVIAIISVIISTTFIL